MKPQRRYADVLKFLRPFRRQIAGLFGLTVMLSVLSMLPPLVTRAIVDRVIQPRDRSLFFALGCVMLCLPLLNALCAYLQTLGIAYVGQKFVHQVRDAVYRHLLNLSMRFFSDKSVGMLVNRLMGDSGTVQNLLTAQTIGVISDLACAAFAITATLALNWRLALLLYLVVAAFVINFRINIAGIRQANRRYQHSLDRLSAGVQNRLNVSLAIKSFGTELREHNAFLGQSESSLETVRGMQFSNITFATNVNLLAEGGRALLYFLGCAMMLSGRVSYGDVIAFTSYAMQLLWPAVRFSTLARQIQDAGVAADRLFEILDAPAEIGDRPNAVAVRRLQGRVDFDRVWFAYEKGKPVIRDFDLHIEPGQTVALIGATGCGKSTILALLLRFCDVGSGCVRLDGRDVRGLRLASLRRQFGIVLQDPLLFTCSIAENIGYGRPGATRAEIEQAARVAEIHDFIGTLPEGYETVIGAEGVQLSLGQRQRLTIARAVAADPAILIMDEATSSLDTESERAIQVAMERVLKNRTAFIVAHRLSTIRTANVLVLLDAGRIAEMGTHASLLAAGGRYAALYARHTGQTTLTV